MPEAARHYFNARMCKDKTSGDRYMFVSGVIATASLVGILVALLGASLALMLVDKHFDAKREH